jgi:hypothetical protein
MKKAQLLKPSHYVRFAYTDLDINGHWGVPVNFDVSKQTWNVALLGTLTDIGTNPVFQVDIGNLLAYVEHAKDLTKDLVALTELKRFKQGLLCALCEEIIVFDVDKIKLSGKTELNYAIIENCGHEIHSSCLPVSCKCPICDWRECLINE